MTGEGDAAKGAIDWARVRQRLGDGQAGIEDERARERARRIFQERSRQLAERSIGEQVQKVAVLTLEAGGETFALKVAEAAEIAVMTVATTLPRTRPALIGIIDRRGVVCSVFDLAALCGLTSTPAARSSGHVVVLRAGGGKVGLRVDRAATIAEVPVSDLAPGDDGSSGTLGRYTRAGLNLLDSEAILSRVDGA